MDAPDRQVDPLRVQCFLPREYVLIDAVDQRAVEIEQEHRLYAHPGISRCVPPPRRRQILSSARGRHARVNSTEISVRRVRSAFAKAPSYGASGIGCSSDFETVPRKRRRDRLANAPANAKAAATTSATV